MIDRNDDFSYITYIRFARSACQCEWGRLCKQYIIIMTLIVIYTIMYKYLFRQLQRNVFIRSQYLRLVEKFNLIRLRYFTLFLYWNIFHYIFNFCSRNWHYSKNKLEYVLLIVICHTRVHSCFITGCSILMAEQATDS